MNYPYDIIPTESSLRNYPYGIIPTELSLRNYPYDRNCCYGDYKIGPIFFLKTLDKWRDLLYNLCIMGTRAPIYIGFSREDKREKNRLKNRVG
jgi:hypothetical protein